MVVIYMFAFACWMLPGGIHRGHNPPLLLNAMLKNKTKLCTQVGKVVCTSAAAAAADMIGSPAIISVAKKGKR